MAIIQAIRIADAQEATLDAGSPFFSPPLDPGMAGFTVAAQVDVWLEIGLNATASAAGKRTLVPAGAIIELRRAAPGERAALRLVGTTPGIVSVGRAVF